ncbi:MAG TPA: zinc ribbon domain-containing protein [Armatimonadetes bacterium]|nr:zinc ribbon domain-containing protein [Armatimonadota bacterium]
MPIYEYRCLDCGRKFAHLHGVIAGMGDPLCPRCGGTNLKKLISRVARLRSEEEVFESLVDNLDFGDVDENDPRSIVKWAKKMGRAMGEDLGEDFDQVIEEMAESGELEGEGSEEGEGGGSRSIADIL